MVETEGKLIENHRKDDRWHRRLARRQAVEQSHARKEECKATSSCIAHSTSLALTPQPGVLRYRLLAHTA